MPSQPAPGGSALKILIADDNSDFCLSMQMVLEAEGYRVRCVSNGSRALAAQRADPADVLITDLFMPERDGFETIESFRREFPGTKIAVVSGDARRTRGDYLASASLIGVDAAFRKPLDPDELVRWLGTLRQPPSGG